MKKTPDPTKPVAGPAVAVIPARYASTRLPGKVLAKDPDGRYLLDYVCRAAAGAELVGRVVVATDHARVREVAEKLGWEAVMTSPEHASGSDRVAEVARGLDAEVVVNVQADEALMRPEMVDQVITLLRDSDDCVVATLAADIESREDLNSPDVVKVVVDDQWRALYFSRLPIPYVRRAARPASSQADDQLRASPAPHLVHVGIYAYRRDFLLRYAQMKPSALERAERLEQLRILAAGYRIKVGWTPHRPMGIDTREDLEAFLRLVRSRTRATTPPPAETEPTHSETDP